MSPRNVSLWANGLNSQLEENPWASAEHTGGITDLSIPRVELRHVVGEEDSPRLPLLIKMDGWINSHSLSGCLWTLSRRLFSDLKLSCEIKLDFFIWHFEAISLMCTIKQSVWFFMSYSLEWVMACFCFCSAIGVQYRHILNYAGERSSFTWLMKCEFT